MTQQSVHIHGQVVGVRESAFGRFMDVTHFGPDEFDAQTISETRQVVIPADANSQISKPRVGDIVSVNGTLGETLASQRRGLGQISLFMDPIDPSSLEIVATSTRPRWPAANQRESFQQQADYARMLVARARMLDGLRVLLNSKHYTHVDTSILQERASGAAARTFSTESNFDGKERHLRIAPEVDLKIVMALSGLERVYEIGRNFRNEGLGQNRHPEFTNLESYTAYQTPDEAVELTQEILQYIASAQGVDIDFSRMPKRSLAELFAAQGLNFERDILGPISNSDIERLKHFALQHGITDASERGGSGIVDALIKKHVRPNLAEPTIVNGYLSDQLPLAATTRGDERFADAFQVITQGSEIVKAYQEEVNATVLLARLRKQVGENEEDIFRTDMRLVEACEMGLPPMYGIGVGLDALTSLITGKRIDKVIPVPINQ